MTAANSQGYLDTAKTVIKVVVAVGTVILTVLENSSPAKN